MSANLATSLRRRRRAAPMLRFDRLPPELRLWLAQAALPWSPDSALRLWRRALAETGCPKAAQARLDAAEARLLCRDAPRVWGPAHPLSPVPLAGAPLSGAPLAGAVGGG